MFIEDIRVFGEITKDQMAWAQSILKIDYPEGYIKTPEEVAKLRAAHEIRREADQSRIFRGGKKPEKKMPRVTDPSSLRIKQREEERIAKYDVIIPSEIKQKVVGRLTTEERALIKAKDSKIRERIVSKDQEIIENNVEEEAFTLPTPLIAGMPTLGWFILVGIGLFLLFGNKAIKIKKERR